MQTDPNTHFQLHPSDHSMPGSVHEPQANHEFSNSFHSSSPVLPGSESLPTSTSSSHEDAPKLAQPVDHNQPVPVVRVLSVRGVEYGMMTIVLLVSATTAAWILLNILNGSRGFDSIVVPTASFVVCLPIFGILFLRLKRAELQDPALRFDPSKRRWSQTTQFLAFTALLVNFIYFVYTLLQHASGGKAQSVFKSFVNLLVVFVIAGGVLYYYWQDEHRARKS
jgi:hypothetical protein